MIHSLDNSIARIAIIGGGLAGCEAALQLANRGHSVRLYDLKPHRRSPAHHSNNLAEIVCSNSFGSQGPSASGLLKQEMQILGCELLKLAEKAAVPAGKALAVDRERFAQSVNDAVLAHPKIEFIGEEVTQFPEDVEAIILATGPLTSEALTSELTQLLNRQQLYFFDAAAPIVTKESINFDIAFIQDRYNKQAEGTEEASYINCPLDKPQYEKLVAFLLEAEKTAMKPFEETTQKTKFFESCMPVEEIASRGFQTLRYGPMKPVGLRDPRTPEDEWGPYAVVQLRQDNKEGTLYNLVGFQTNIKWGPQKEMIRLIPGLENAEVVRYGVMHRNTFIHSPEVLQPTLQLKKHPHIWIAGQLSGTEGYTESVATGLLAAINVDRVLAQREPMLLPAETMLGSLTRYITREEAIGKNFQPINSNWGLVPPLETKIKDKKERAACYVERSLKSLKQWVETESMLEKPLQLA